MKENNTIIVIPARIGSTRLPKKPLKLIAGKPLIEWVINIALKVRNADKVIVATDDMEIANIAIKLGIDFLISKKSHRNGTERLIEVASKYSSDFYINLQGDEPLINPLDIEFLIEKLKVSSSGIVTLCHKINATKADDFSRVKVVRNLNNEALYFSRNKIPYGDGDVEYLQHEGIYGFNEKSLKLISFLKKTNLEVSENLEQLRWIQSGLKIEVFKINTESVGVDTLDDAKEVERILMLKGLKVIFSDVDGILTDGKIWYGINGEEIKSFNAKDGLAIKTFIKNGIEVCLLSARDSIPLRNRTKDLGIKHFIFGDENKLNGCKSLLEKLKINKNQAAFIGDDIIDLEAMKYCGWSFTVSDAVKPVLDEAKTILNCNGGEGAIREIYNIFSNI